MTPKRDADPRGPGGATAPPAAAPRDLRVGKAGFGRGLAGGVKRGVAAEERAVLAGLRPDAQTQALLDSLAGSTVAAPGDAPAAGTPRSASAALSAADPVTVDRSLTDVETTRPVAELEAPASRPDAPAVEATREATHAAPSHAGAARPIELLPVDAVAPSPHQARRVFTDIDELAESILATGLQHPILVRRNRPGAARPYTLVFGERRHRAFGRLQGHEDAAVRARHARIPAFVLQTHELSDARLAVLTAEENALRAELAPWELARNVVELKEALEAEEGRPVTFERLARHFNLQAGSTNEYYTIGSAFPEPVLREAGLTDGVDVDWLRVAALKKQRLLAIARKAPAERVALLRTYALAERGRRGRRTGPRFSVEQLRTQGGFTLKIEKPVSSDSYTRTQGESFLRDLEPALALLAEIAGEGRPAYRPDDANLPGTYLVLRDAPDRLSAEERRQALEVVEALRRELSRR